MTISPVLGTTMRTYTRENNDHIESVFVHVTPEGYIRMKADNLHDVLTHIGFRQENDA